MGEKGLEIDMESMVQNDPVLGQYVNNPLPPVRAALVSSEGLNTERLARERTLSASLGIPPRLLRPDMDKAEREALAQRIQSDPVLARYAGMSPENAAIVRDDEGGLLGVIHAVGEAGRDIGEAWGAGKRQIELSDMGNRLADGDESALADIDAWHERERTFPERDTLADTLGLTSAVTQLPRMFSRDIPEAVKYAAGGALAGGGSGAIIGSAIPGVGTAGGAAAGLRIGGGAGWALGSGVAAYRAERGNFAAQFSQERDENGNRPDLETLTVSADTYALLSAGIETLGEALFLKLLKPVAGQALGRLGIRGWLYSAVKEAAKDKSALAVMGDITRRVLAGAALEGLEEGSQQLVSILVESTAKRHATRAGVNQFADEGLLPSGAGAEILESAVEGAKAGLWLSGGPTIILGAGEVRKARQTAEWAQKQKMLKSAVDQTKVQTASPELSESFLRRGAGVTGNVSIPADAVLELHQSGMDILEPMGWQAQDVADAAAMGQELEVPLSRLHTRLDNTTFGAVIDVARRTPDSMTAVEAAQINERIQADTEEVNDAFMEYQAEQNTIDAEMERVRSEISGAVGSVPGLASQVRADSTLEETAAADGMTPEKAADYYSRLLLNWAERRQERTGAPIAESLRKVNVRGLVRDESGKLLTPEEHEARLINRELEEAQAPFWDAVWGRLDRESLKRDYPDAVRELTAIYGRGIFARKGQGRALDDLAQEMESFYILPEGGGADALMERLKQGSRPSLRMRQGIKGKSLFQPLNKGVNLDRMISTTFIQRKYPAATLKEKRTAVSKGEKKSVLQAFKKGVRNEDTGWVIGMSGNDFDEHLKSDYASSYLMDQYEAVSALPKLMEKAVLVESHDDSHGRANVKKVHRFYAPLSIDGDTYSVVLTVKEFQNGVLLVDAKSPMKLYHHRLVKKMLPVQRGSVALQESPESDPGSISSYSLRELLENVKDNDGIPYFQSAYHGTPHRFKAIKVLDTYYQFLGEQGAANLDRAEEASTRLDNLAVAREMEDAGRDAKTVKLATGWERGADGKWRYEIPDGKIRADAGLGTSTLGELYDAPELYAAYPELLAVDVTFQPMEGIKGSYTGNSIVLSDAYLTHEETKDILSTLVHEIQHIIQRREGFARGGSPAQFAVNEDGLTDIGPMLMQNRLARARSLMDSADAGLREKMRAMNRAMLEKDFERLAALEDSLTDEENEVWDSYWWMTSEARTIRDEGRLVTPQDAYEAIQGEAEARNVQKRIDMSKEERLASLAAETEDVAREDQIFLRGTLANESREAASQPRASITPVGDEYLIQLYKGADLSSLLHETGHMFLFEMEQDIRAGLADESLRADYDTLQAWLGTLDDDAALKAEYDRSMKQTVAAYGKREFDALPDWMKEDARNRAKQEMFARGFEQYLREGKAPARSLESAFTRFRKWLLNIYRKALQLNVELTDDVRGVFDRLLATDAEMNARAVENGLVDLTARELDALGLKGADRIAVSGLMKSAVDAAAERMRADRDRRRDEQLKTWAREAKTEVESLPVYAARRDMQKIGLDKDAVRRNYGDRLVGEVLHALPGSLRNKGGADPELFALEHGFEDAGSMLLAVRDAARKGDMMRELIHRKQAEWDAGFHAEDYLLDTEEVAKQIELVGRYAREALEKTVVGKERPPRMAEQSVLARVVSEKLAGMEMGRAMRTNTFRMAMRRALAAERRAIVAGNWQAVLDANFQARINMEFARQSLELKRGAERLQERIKSFTGMKRADADARFLVGALAQRHGMGRLDPRLVTEERRNPVDVLQTWLKGAEEDGYPLFLENAFTGSDLFWKDMSVNDFRDVANGIGQIMTVERNRRKLLTARNKADLDAVAKEIGESVAAFRKASPVKTVEKENPALKTLKGIHAVHTKIEALCLALDGGKPGPMWEYVYRPITAAEDNQSVRFRGARDALQKLFFNAYSRKELFAMRRNREYVESVGEKLTRENMIALALNMGNETNIKRVREGHKWTDAQIRDVLARLTRKDWEFVQGVWDYLETFRDESFRLQEDITGMRPQAVEATPLTVTTADGETMTLRGGYYPIKYNSEKGFMAFQREQKEMDREFFGGNSYSAAQTRQGHLKDRARKGTEEPLLLELSVVTDHVFNVIHDLSYRRAVLDVAKVIKHPVVRDAVRGAVGMEMYGELKPWLMDVANERQEPMHAVHRMANWARASSSVMQMGWKVTTMLAQPLGLLQTADVIGYRDTAAGLKKVYSNPLRLPELLDETFARSPMMAERMRSFDREIRDMTKKLMPSSGLFGWVDKIRDSAFLPIGVIQMGVDLPTWWGGYIRGLREFHGDETRAAEYADSIVRMSQGSGSTKDLARVQRGGPLLRLATMFYSYFNTFYNLAARRFTELRLDRSPAAVFRAANTALLLWFLPSVLGELVVGRGPDDDEEWDEWTGMQILQYPFQAVVGVRDLASGIFGEYGYQITPAESAPASLVKWFKAVNRALEEEDAGGLAKPTAEAAGYLFGLPMKQPIITVGNIWDYVTGEDPDFYVRDLLFVKPKDRR